MELRWNSGRAIGWWLRWNASGAIAGAAEVGRALRRSGPTPPPYLAVNRSKHEGGPLPAGLGSYCVKPSARTRPSASPPRSGDSSTRSVSSTTDRLVGRLIGMMQAVEQRPELWLGGSRRSRSGFTRFGSQPNEQSTMTLFRARSRRASSRSSSWATNSFEIPRA